MNTTPETDSHDHDWHEQTIAMTRDIVYICTICKAHRTEHR